jgi:hypothetical protein
MMVLSWCWRGAGFRQTPASDRASQIQTPHTTSPAPEILGGNCVLDSEWKGRNWGWDSLLPTPWLKRKGQGKILVITLI